MYKLTAIALLAALGVAFVLASPTLPQLDLDSADDNDLLDDYEVDSQVALFPEDDDELKNLPEEQKVFSDYCISSRDQTKKWLTEKRNEAAQRAFESLFDKLITVGKNSIMASRQATQEQTGELRDPDAAAAAAGEQQPQDNLFQKIFNACRMVVQKTYEVARQTVTEYARDVMAEFTRKDLEIVERACRQFTSDLRPQLQGQFEQVKNSFTKANPSLKETIGALSIKEVKCTTARRVMTIGKSCETFATLQTVVLPMLMQNA